MIVSKEALAKIKKIIEKNYSRLLIGLVGNTVFTEEELELLKEQGIDADNQQSLLSMVYYNNVLNELKGQNSPKNISDMKKQQAALPEGEAHEAATEHINESFKHVVDKMKADVQSRVEGMIRDNNMLYRGNALQNLDRPDDIDQLVKESTLGGLKQALRDASKDVNRNWERIAVTETSNAIGMGSVDRIIMQNKNKDLEEVYVFRIPVNDAALCKFCRKFYLDEDQTPALYKLTTLLNNGTNYGKKTPEWQAVVGATHPNDRESGVIELRPGWKVGSDGSVEYIGLEKWDEYIKDKLRG